MKKKEVRKTAISANKKFKKKIKKNKMAMTLRKIKDSNGKPYFHPEYLLKELSRGNEDKS